jgi:hypothetical protein
MYCIVCNTNTNTNTNSWALLKRPPVVKPLNSFLAFCRTRRFITTFTRALQLSLSWARPIQSIPQQTISPRLILIFSTHLRLCVPSGLFPPDFPTNNLNMFLSTFHSCYMLCPYHFLRLDRSNYIWWTVHIILYFSILLHCIVQWVLQVMLPSACSFIVLVFTVIHYMFRPTWPSSSV